MDGTAKIRLVAFGLVLLFLGSCSKFSEEPRPNSLLPATLPDIQVPLSDSGTGNIDIATANHLLGAYSIKFGTPKHGRIEISADSTVFKYIANPDFRGSDTASYTITKPAPIIGTSTGQGNLIFYTSATVCFAKAIDDYYESTASAPYFINVLTNDELCNDSIAIAPVSGGIHGNFYRHPTNGAIIVYAPDSISAYKADSTTYTIQRNGFESTAKVVVNRIRPSDCQAIFQPKDDEIHLGDTATRYNIRIADLLANDESCGDINPRSFQIDSSDFYGTWTLDSQSNPTVIRCRVNNPGLSNYGVFKYSVARTFGAAARKHAIVRIVRP